MMTDYEFTPREKRKRLIIFSVIAWIIAIAAVYVWADGWLLCEWHSKAAHWPVQDGALQLSLAGRRFSVKKDGENLWQTPKEWKVSDYLLLDLDGDEQDELVLLVWKRGSYGEHKPFWVQKDEIGFSQHIFIYQYKNSALRAMWMSSALRPQVKKWAALPQGRLQIITPKGETTVWRWGNWGLVRET